MKLVARSGVCCIQRVVGVISTLRSGDIDVFKSLVERGKSNTFAVDADNCNPFDIAAAEGHVNITSYMLGIKVREKR